MSPRGQGYPDLSGNVTATAIPGLFQVQTSLVLRNAALDTKCSQKFPRISVNQPELCSQANHSTSERRFIASWCRIGASPRCLCRRLDLQGFASHPLRPPQHPPNPPPPARSGDCCCWGRTSPSPSPLLGAGGGGSILRPNVSSFGVETPLASFKLYPSLQYWDSSTRKFRR